MEDAARAQSSRRMNLDGTHAGPSLKIARPYLGESDEPEESEEDSECSDGGHEVDAEGMSTDSDLATANPDAAEDINDEDFFPDMTGDESSEADEEDDEEDSERMMKRMKNMVKMEVHQVERIPFVCLVNIKKNTEPAVSDSEPTALQDVLPEGFVLCSAPDTLGKNVIGHTS